MFVKFMDKGPFRLFITFYILTISSQISGDTYTANQLQHFSIQCKA